jgi:hypothetical protein
VTEARLNFVRQQGFGEATGATCGIQYPALAFQPRAIGVLLLAGVILQSPTLFLVLSAVLIWNALVPVLNPFDWLYASLVALRTGRCGQSLRKPLKHPPLCLALLHVRI